MPQREASARALIAACLAVLLAPQWLAAIDGLPVGVELTNTDSATLGWVRIADDDGLEPQAFTIEAWITPLGDGYGMTLDDWGAIIVAKPMEQQGGYCISSFYLNWSPVEGRLASFVTHDLGANCTYFTSTSTIPLGARAHIAMTFDGVSLRLFVNGQLDREELANAGNVDYGDEDVLIGAANFSGGNYRAYQGIVDDVRIWDHARDAATISAYMDCSLDGTEPGLLAYYSFNAGDARDDSGQGHDGVADGLVSYVLSNDLCLPFASGFESGELSDWSASVP